MEVLAFGFGFDTIDSWISAGGYAVLFGLLFACGLGLPLPEDIPLLISGALVANGKMDLAYAGIAAWCGIIGGDIMLYQISRRVGMEITKTRFIGKHLSTERIQKLAKMFDDYGIFVVGFGRLFAGVRGVMVVAAGVTRYNFWKFIITDGLAAILSGGFFMFVGHWLGSNLNDQSLRKFKSEFREFILPIILIFLVGVLCWMLWRRRKAEERVEKVAAKAESIAEAAHLKKPPTHLP